MKTKKVRLRFEPPTRFEVIPVPAAPFKTCAVLGFVDGICVSKCANKSAFAEIVQGDWADAEMCAPCMMLPAGTAAGAAP